MVPGWFFHGSRMDFHSFMSVIRVFHDSRSVFMVFHGSRWVVHGSRSVFMLFNGSRLVFNFHVESTLKLYSGLTIQSRPCRPQKKGFV